MRQIKIETPGAICSTNGKGYWSEEKRDISIISIKLKELYDDGDEGDCDFADIEVKFNTKDWNVNKHGLIYTDPKWLKDFRKLCDSLGLPGRDVDYTEQGMQGRSFVSMNAGKKFIKAWEKVTGQPLKRPSYID